MKVEIIFIILFVFSNSLFSEDIETITFSKDGITTSGDGAEISGTEVKIKKPKTYKITGYKEEGNVVITTSNVEIILSNLILFSEITAPLIVNSNLNNIRIITESTSILKDSEDYQTSKGEKSVIKIKKNSIVYFQNKAELILYGECGTAIKGSSNSSLIFEKSEGKYTINSNKSAINSESYLEFNGGNFDITSGGDGIVAEPDAGDEIGLGKIFIKDGNFVVKSKGDGFSANKNITIINGKFRIKTENGYDIETFDPDTDSAKGLKIKSNETGSGMMIINANMEINAADDGIHSKRDLTIKRGKYIIHSGDDGVHAGYDLIIGEKDAPNTRLNLSVFFSYEALEAMTITIYSGKIIATSTDDGINASGGNGGDDPGPGPGPGPGPWNRTFHLRRNDTPPGPDPGPGPRPRPGPRGNASYYITIYSGEIYVFCDGDGIDSNGNIFIHGGNITIFSQGNRDNEPIDHDGNFTLFNADILGVGSRGMEKVHEGIQFGNEMYAYYDKDITKRKFLKIINDKGEIIRDEYINKDINYIFYTSLNLNSNYTFYIREGDNETKLNMTFGKPKEKDDDDKGGSDENIGNYLHNRFIGLITICLILVLF